MLQSLKHEGMMKMLLLLLEEAGGARRLPPNRLRGAAGVFGIYGSAVGQKVTPGPLEAELSQSGIHEAV